MRKITIAVLGLLVTGPALAEDLPQGPKARPPQPLPEAACDTSLPNNGEWLIGRWVGPMTRMEFTRKAPAITWVMDRKGGPTEFGWQSGAQIDGKVDTVTGCTVTMSAGENGAFTFEGVVTDEGKLYGFATNLRGETVRFTLRRER